MIDRIGIDVFEAVLSELQLIVAQEWISVDSIVRRRTDVMRESPQSQLRRLDASADDGPPFEHHAAVARLRQVGRGDQAIVACARDDDIESLSHGT